ncbi:Peptidylprolyl isomerase [Melia azedarach]|uniref:Peptidylprolyl isomerase n=1 Tax=Melia azedarach TaxID=155640 RepID=A0ACC1X1N3_MELAZ|nr:Peptidylprolyl isomerase [Melia azedarach]
MALFLFTCYHQQNPILLLHKSTSIRTWKRSSSSNRKSSLLRCNCSLSPSSSSSSSSSSDETKIPAPVALQCERRTRRPLIASLLIAAGISPISDVAEAVSTSRRALRASKIPESEFKTLPNGLKYYDLKVGSGLEAVKGSRVAVHYVAKWKGITFMTSRQGLGVGGGTPYGFDVGQSERGTVLKGLDLGVKGMRVGGQRLLIVPPELAYGSKGVQEIPPNATIELDVELLSIKQSPFGSPVKIVEG